MPTMETVTEYIDKYSHLLLPALGRILLALVIFFVGRRLIDALLRRIAMLGERFSSLDYGLRKFILSLVKVGLWALLIYLIAYFIGVPTATFIALIGSVGVTVGLALQGSLSNFASGVLLLFLHPFRVGDFIETGSILGKVTDIGLFYTTIQTLGGLTVSIPNGTLAGGNITNWDTTGTIRLDIPVSISYKADIQAATDILVAAANRREKVIDKEKTSVFVSKLGESGIELKLLCWINNEDYWSELSAITKAAKEALDEAGIEIPYNQMDVHIIP